MNIRLLCRDDCLAVCVKPVGVDSESELCALLSEQTGSRAYCVHRLDRGVGGVMVYALSPASAAALSRSVAEGLLRKEYLAVCEGRPRAASGELRDLLYHDAAKNKSFVVQRKRRGVREAVLDYRSLETAEGLTLLQIALHTGRSHQIRVQFASRGLPLCGDGRYGAKTRGGVALWSYSLAFPHPESGETLCFQALPPCAPPWSGFTELSAST